MVWPKNTGDMPRRWKIPISPSLNILIFVRSEEALFDSYIRTSNTRGGRLPSSGGGTTVGIPSNARSIEFSARSYERPC